MARKNIILPYKIFDGVDLATDQTSLPTDVSYLDNIGIIVEWSGTSPVGELFVECANPPEHLKDPSDWTWVPLDFGRSIGISDDSGNHDINMTQLPYSKLRMQFKRTSGAGQMTATLVAKQVGG